MYINNILIISRNDKMIKFITNISNSRFDMKDKGNANVNLEVKI